MSDRIITHPANDAYRSGWDATFAPKPAPVERTVDGVVYTGVFATSGEIAYAKELAAEARNAPVMKVGNTWFHESADRDFRSALDAMAELHGLPALGLIDGEPDHYGMTGKGEFTRVERPDCHGTGKRPATNGDDR